MGECDERFDYGGDYQTTLGRRAKRHSRSSSPWRPSGRRRAGGDQRKATISDDADDALSWSVASEEDSVEEGSDANFPVTLSGTSTADVVVKYTIAGIDPDGDGSKEAAEKEDYEVPGNSVTIPAGTNTATITIPIVADDLLEPNETLQVTLMSPTTAKGALADRR